ncbi:hypothetical protein D6T64_11775 [Cryobacterium melibiosiphilum]|uniref:Uncharacterized protein n=1 Tax=Cryobacterium melibiosiphilum TaxID=995039 RepID=A0A3A5MGS9_9MICO|nr:hypothetical protein [Cryobacterium melibiosiphilum]RJT88061.1 hypothetical protein D6T64_11775 [Cryobacterium melibiosiphilum]
MSKPVFLFRAVTARPLLIEHDGVEDVLAPGFVIGRQSGYLSRSSAKAVAFRNHFAFDEFEVIQSEPVRFLTAAEKTEKRIAELEAELASLRVPENHGRSIRDDVDARQAGIWPI